MLRQPCGKIPCQTAGQSDVKQRKEQKYIKITGSLSDSGDW